MSRRDMVLVDDAMTRGIVQTEMGGEMMPSSEIETARKEIEDLLDAMSRGDPLNRSEEVMLLCSRLAGQMKDPSEADDATSWSAKLAADLGKFRDECSTGLMKSWSCTSCAFIPISLRGFFPPLVNSPPLSGGRKGGVVLLGSGGVDRLVRTRVSEQRLEELKISAMADADTPPDPPSERGETWPHGRNKTIAEQAIRLTRSRPTFHHPSARLNYDHSPIAKTRGSEELFA